MLLVPLLFSVKCEGVRLSLNTVWCPIIRIFQFFRCDWLNLTRNETITGIYHMELPQKHPPNHISAANSGNVAIRFKYLNGLD